MALGAEFGKKIVDRGTGRGRVAMRGDAARLAPVSP
jgi:hypothetical protein